MDRKGQILPPETTTGSELLFRLSLPLVQFRYSVVQISSYLDNALSISGAWQVKLYLAILRFSRISLASPPEFSSL